MRRRKPGTIVSCFTWPLLIFGSIYIAHLGFNAGLSLGLWSFVITVINLGLIVILERVWPRKVENKLQFDRRAIHDIAHGGLYATVGQPLGTSFATLAVAYFYSDLGENFNGLWPGQLPFVLQVALAVLIFSVGDYIKHRLYHSIDSLWWIHAVHHDTPQLHVLKAGRLHFIEAIIRSAIVQLPLVFLGTPVEVLIWMALWINFEGHLNHSNLDQSFPNWMHWIFQTVDIHEIHHSIDRKYQNSNYAYPIIDWIFGTFNPPSQTPEIAVGLSENQVPSSFTGQLLLPLKPLKTVQSFLFKRNHIYDPTKK